VDVGALHLPKLTQMIARSAQRYGLVVRDQTHHAIALFGENPSRSPGNAYQRYFRGRTPQELLARFPWDRAGTADAPLHHATVPPRVINLRHACLDGYLGGPITYVCAARSPHSGKGQVGEV
jgi:hypothetical protein